MSRVRNAARSLLSGYVAIATNVIYTLGSVPLALHYLSEEQFGLWSQVVQAVGYLALLDFGFIGALGRVLMDHKDARQDGQYGTVIKTGAVALAIQGLGITLGGVICGYFLPSLLQLPPEFTRVFGILVAGQSAVLGLFFSSRTLLALLQAYQRFDLTNYTQIGQLVLGFASQWITFHLGWGVYSLLAAALVSMVFGVALNLVWVLRLGLFAERGARGRVDWGTFKEVFAYGNNLFLLSVGGQLLNASQGLIITREMGLRAAAVWAVASKAFQLAFQFVQRIFDFSGSALGEMIVRGEREKLKARFGEVLLLTASFVVFAGTSVALCNGSFVPLWTKGKLERARIFICDRSQARRENLVNWLSNGKNVLASAAGEEEAIKAIRKLHPDLIILEAENGARLMAEARAADPKVAIIMTTMEKGAAAPTPGVKDFLSDQADAKVVQTKAAHALAKRMAKWPWWNDALLGVLLIFNCVSRCQIGLSGYAKQLRVMRWIYFLEGATFVIAACLVIPHFGIGGMIFIAIVANLVWSAAYGIRWGADYLGIRCSEMIGWLKPAARYLAVIAPITGLIWWGTFGLPLLARLLVDAGVMLILGPALLWKVGLTPALRIELANALRKALRG